MDKELFNEKFDIAFQNALHRSFDEIKLPEPHIILESWKAIQEKLPHYADIVKKFEK